MANNDPAHCKTGALFTRSGSSNNDAIERNPLDTSYHCTAGSNSLQIASDLTDEVSVFCLSGKTPTNNAFFDNRVRLGMVLSLQQRPECQGESFEFQLFCWWCYLR
jgi:hypothetical protein